MKIKATLLTLLLVLGFSLQNCDDDDLDCFCPTPAGRFFDVQGLTVMQDHRNQATIPFVDYSGFAIEYEVNYYGQSTQPKSRSWSISLINTAYACSCLEDGWNGSENESIRQLTFITVNDFDDNHLANTPINDLLNVRLGADPVDLTEFLEQQQGELLREPFLEFQLKSAPTSGEAFQVKAILELSTDEIYEATSDEILITN